MGFIQKIYYNNKPLVLASEQPTHTQYEGYELISGANAKNFDDALKMLDKHSCKGILIIEPDRELLEKELLWAFYPLHSGGGVVLNENGDVLMIFRRGRWDLPKGKLDEGEDIEQCAVREVIEETGLKTVTIKSKICNTLHIYPLSGKLILKYTAWYIMQGVAGEALLPQAEENIEKAMWVKPSEIPQLLENSFETIGDVLIEAKIL
ncbi:MAG: NUDIX domain-containing protein [Chitinophagaceae bacterium]|nr:NUDIX domain-containing protein [Chitinophagaceae bacterium]